MRKLLQGTSANGGNRWVRLSSLLWRWSYQRRARSRDLALVQVWGRR